MKLQVERFHLNGHFIGFRPQSQNLKTPYKTPLFTMAVKGLRCHHQNLSPLAVRLMPYDF